MKLETGNLKEKGNVQFSIFNDEREIATDLHG
jgi:hypothetical protein